MTKNMTGNIDYGFTIDGEAFIANIDWRCTYAGRPMRGPSFNSPGEPAEPAEFDLTVKWIARDDGARKGETLELPQWLVDLLEESESVYSAVYDDWEASK